jgi:alpha-tubulin suppressor-like RCC1 family protein
MGNNASGQLGDGTTTSRTAPVSIATGVVAMATGVDHSPHIRSDFSVWAMGRNDGGQLGNGATANLATPVQVMAAGKALAAGRGHSVVLKQDGTLWSCGKNSAGQLGSSGVAQRSAFALIATDLAALAAGELPTGFVRADGTLWMTGSNFNHGTLGDGTYIRRSAPLQVASDVARVACGNVFTTFVSRGGDLWGMGFNEPGQLPDGSGVLVTRPALVFAQVAHFDLSGGGALSMVDKGRWIGPGGRAQFQRRSGGRHQHQSELPRPRGFRGQRGGHGLVPRFLAAGGRHRVGCGRERLGAIGRWHDQLGRDPAPRSPTVSPSPMAGKRTACG